MNFHQFFKSCEVSEKVVPSSVFISSHAFLQQCFAYSTSNGLVFSTTDKVLSYTDKAKNVFQNTSFSRKLESYMAIVSVFFFSTCICFFFFKNNRNCTCNFLNTILPNAKSAVAQRQGFSLGHTCSSLIGTVALYDGKG